MSALHPVSDWRDRALWLKRTWKGRRPSEGDGLIGANGGLVAVAAQGVLEAADGVLDLAGDLIGTALGLQFFVAGQLAGGFLDLAADVLGGAFDTVMIRHGNPLC